MKYIWNYFLSILLGGCMGSADYMVAPENAIRYGSGSTPINPDKLKVNPDDYPQYVAPYELQPPSINYFFFGKEMEQETTVIKKSDIWKVTHKLGNILLIQSDIYADRQCRYLDSNDNSSGQVVLFGRCVRSYDYAIYINGEGHIQGGWALLPGPQKILTERRTYLYPNPESNQRWPIQFGFIPIR